MSSEESVAFARLVIAAAALTALWMLEARLGTIETPIRRRKHAIANLTLAAINAAALYFTVGLMTLAVARWAAVGQTEWPFARGVATLLGLDAFSYAWHRANHRLPFLWRFHRVHHSDDAMDVTSAGRFHTGELFLAALVRLPLIVFLGISPLLLLVYETILVSVSLFHHSRIRLGAAERWVRCVIVTPEMHDIHHRREEGDSNHNFASVLSVWDRIFGSHRKIARSADPRTGIDGIEGGNAQSIQGMLTTPFCRFDENQGDSK